MKESYFRKIKFQSIDYLIIAAFFILAASFISPVIMTTVHAVINIFAGGRSVSKALLFLLYLAILAITAKIFQNKNFKNFLRYKIIFLGALTAGFFLNIVSFFYFIKINGFGTKDWILSFGGPEISSTSFLHNHVLKGAIGLLLNLCGVSSMENLDAGFVFTDALPKIIFVAAIILIFFLIFWSIFLFVVQISGKELKILPIFTISYAIIIFSLIKNIVDGGFFNHETIISLAFLILLLFPQKRWTKYLSGTFLIFYLISISVFYFLGFFDSSESAIHGFIAGLFGAICYTVPLFTLYYFQKNKINRQGILLIILAALTINFSLMGDLGIISYRSKAIDKDNPANFGVYKKIFRDDYREIGSIGDLNFYQIEPEKSITAGSILDQYDIQDNFYPLVFPYRNCFPRGRPTIYEYQFISPEKLEFERWRNEFVGLTIKKTDFKKDNFFYQISMEIKPCLPRHLNIIQETWKTIGINKFFILNIKESGHDNN